MAQKPPPPNDLPIGLSQPAIRALTSAGLLTLSKLSTATEAQVASLHGMGPSGIKLLKEALRKKGLAFSKAK